MSIKSVIAISTFRKPLALEACLASIFEHGYDKDNIIHVADDGEGEEFTTADGTVLESAVSVVSRYPGVKISYGKSRLGISGNKNRSIKFFLESDADDLFLFDDDQVFLRPGLIEELREVCKRNRINHVTGQWSSGEPELEQLTGGGWSSVFPPQAEGYHLTWHENGSHGCAHFFTRKCIEAIGYWDTYKAKYGYEHAGVTARAMLGCDRRSPTWHPQHTHAGKYYKGQNVPNNYEIENVHANSDEWKALMHKVYNGYGLYNPNSGLGKGEVTK